MTNINPYNYRAEWKRVGDTLICNSSYTISFPNTWDIAADECQVPEYKEYVRELIKQNYTIKYTYKLPKGYELEKLNYIFTEEELEND